MDSTTVQFLAGESPEHHDSLDELKTYMNKRKSTRFSVMQGEQHTYSPHHSGEIQEIKEVADEQNSDPPKAIKKGRSVAFNSAANEIPTQIFEAPDKSVSFMAATIIDDVNSPLVDESNDDTTNQNNNTDAPQEVNEASQSEEQPHGDIEAETLQVDNIDSSNIGTQDEEQVVHEPANDSPEQ